MSARKQELIDMIDAAQAGYDKYKPQFDELGEYYLSVMNSGLMESLAKRNKSRLFFPKINAKVKRVVASFQESYFSTDKFASLSSADSENAEIAKKTETLQKAVDYYTTHKMDSLFETFSPIFYDVSIFGTVVARVYWANDKPIIENIKLKDIRFDPSSRSARDVRYIVHDIYLTVDDIKGLQRSGVYKQNINAEELAVAEFEEDATKHSRIKLQEVYTQNKKGTWTVSTFHDGVHAFRQDVELKDGNPFIIGGLIPQVEMPEETDIVRVYYDSIISATIPLQNEINIRRNQQIDAIKNHLEPQMIIPSISGINPVDIERGSRFLRSKNPAQITIVPPPNINYTQSDVQQLDVEMGENLGVSAQQNGVSPSTKQTATESSILSNEGNSRIQAYIRSFNETFFKQIFKRTSQLVWKYGEERLFAGVSRGEPFEFIARINTGLGATNKEIQLAGIERSFSMSNQLLQMAMATQDLETAKQTVQASKKLMREALPLLGIENVEEYLGEENGKQQLGETGSIGNDDGRRGMEDYPNGAEQYEDIGLPAGLEQQQGFGTH